MGFERTEYNSVSAVTAPQRQQTHWQHSTWCDSPTWLCSFLKETQVGSITQELASHFSPGGKVQVILYIRNVCFRFVYLEIILTISGSVPVAGVSCVETSAAFLHDGTVYCKASQTGNTHSHPSSTHQDTVQVSCQCTPWGGELTYVFEWPALFHQVRQRVLHYAGRPLVHFTLVIICSTNNALNTLGQTQTHTEKVRYADIMSESWFITNYSSLMQPGMMRYLFNRDIGLIGTEDHLQKKKKKEGHEQLTSFASSLIRLADVNVSNARVLQCGK